MIYFKTSLWNIPCVTTSNYYGRLKIEERYWFRKPVKGKKMLLETKKYVDIFFSWLLGEGEGMVKITIKPESWQKLKLFERGRTSTRVPDSWGQTKARVQYSYTDNKKKLSGLKLYNSAQEPPSGESLRPNESESSELLSWHQWKFGPI